MTTMASLGEASQAPALRAMPPLRVTQDPTVPAAETLATASVTALAPRLMLDEPGVRAAVGDFAAATLVPPTASEETRRQVHASWAGAVTVLTVAEHPNWALAYVPGTYVGDALVHAVHLTTGHVFGGDHGPTVQQDDETTDAWLNRLDDDFDAHAAAYYPTYVRYTDHA